MKMFDFEKFVICTLLAIVSSLVYKVCGPGSFQGIVAEAMFWTYWGYWVVSTYFIDNEIDEE